ncbi:hypothetical protein BDR05DRAFT_624748 [Suillus weaverae]|nr:hypothetical protein BDR05DRAFT_624748 [Suillus weaverae]
MKHVQHDIHRKLRIMIILCQSIVRASRLRNVCPLIVLSAVNAPAPTFPPVWQSQLGVVMIPSKMMRERNRRPKAQMIRAIPLRRDESSGSGVSINIPSWQRAVLVVPRWYLRRR